MPQANPYPLRIDRELMEKIKVVSSEHGRSVNKEIEILVKQAVKEFESANGEISVSAE